MRNVLIASALIVCAFPSAARAQSKNFSVQGFGGLTFGSSSFIGGTSTSSSLGGVVTAAITPNVIVIGEVGRLADLRPPLFDLLDITPGDLRVSAWYGQGGVRFIAGRSAIRPYAEATAGMARLSTGVSGLGDRTDAIVSAALPFLNQTEPMVGVGGGLLLSHGPLAVDVGYRFKKILANGVSSALNLGNAYQVNEVRFGVGVRF